MDILEQIPKGRENAIHLQELEKQTLKSSSYIKTKIRKARVDGVPIMSGACGYWIAESNAEQAAFVAGMRKQALTRLYSIKHINRAIAGQMTISDYISKELQAE